MAAQPTKNSQVYSLGADFVLKNAKVHLRGLFHPVRHSKREVGYFTPKGEIFHETGYLN